MLHLRRVFFLRHGFACLGEVRQIEPSGLQFGAGRLERPIWLHVVGHLATSLLAAGFTRVRRDQAHVQHQLDPCTVVVALLAGLAELLLLEVCHLMHQRRQHGFQCAVHGRRVQGDLMRRVAIFAMRELFGPEVAIGLARRPQGEQHRRQAIIEQGLVEVIERAVERIIGLSGGGLPVHHHHP